MLTLVTPDVARKAFAKYFCVAFSGLIVFCLIFSQNIGLKNSVAFILFCASFIFWENKRFYLANPLSILHTTFYLIFFAIPALFLICTKSWGESGLDFWFGIKLPEPESTYIENLFKSLFFSTITCFLGCFALSIVRNKTYLKKVEINAKRFLIVGSLIIIGCNAASIVYQKNLTVFDGPAVSLFSYFALFLQDYAILIYASFFLAKEETKKSLKISCILLILIWFIFNMTSKSALLKIFLFSTLMAIALNQKIHNAKLYILNKKAISVLVIFMFLLFQVGYEFKQSYNAGTITYFEAVKNVFSSHNQAGNEKKEMYRRFFARLSMELSYFNALFLQFNHPNDSALISHYASAILHSFVNQVVPGTPFPKSKGISNQYMRSILVKEKIDTSDFRGDENSNPYTCIGFFWLFSGYLTPVFYFLLCFALSKIMSTLSSQILAISVATLFFGLLAMSGIENILKIFLIMLFNYFLVYLLCCKKPFAV